MKHKLIIAGVILIVGLVIINTVLTLRWRSVDQSYSETEVTTEPSNKEGYDTKTTYKVTYSKGHWPVVNKTKTLVKREDVKSTN